MRNVFNLTEEQLKKYKNVIKIFQRAIKPKIFKTTIAGDEFATISLNDKSIDDLNHEIKLIQFMLNNSKSDAGERLRKYINENGSLLGLK